MKELEHKKLIADQAQKWLGWGLILALLLVILWLNHFQFLELFHFFRNREAVTAYLEPLGWGGPLLYLLIILFQVLSATIPGHALMIAAGYLYGFPLGLALNLIGGVGASQVAFVLARRAGQAWVSRVLPQPVLHRWQPVVERRGFFFFLTCFWLPIVPHNATNYLAGLGSISFGRFLLANFLGRLPGMILVTLIGSHGFELTGPQWGLLAAAGLLLLLGGRYLAAKLRSRWDTLSWRIEDGG
ncbi:MAG: TVP38/TMEM64 family protein [Anaerolineae bacterium]|nr:TVP38/TMEM64 family protein [Anaerolineae bacterium]